MAAQLKVMHFDRVIHCGLRRYFVLVGLGRTTHQSCKDLTTHPKSAALLSHPIACCDNDSDDMYWEGKTQDHATGVSLSDTSIAPEEHTLQVNGKKAMRLFILRSLVFIECRTSMTAQDMRSAIRKKRLGGLPPAIGVTGKCSTN